MNKKWESYKIDESLVEQLSKKHNISALLARILVNRGIVDDKKVKNFLHPSLDDLNDPFLFNDMDKAVKRIVDAINTVISIFKFAGL